MKKLASLALVLSACGASEAPPLLHGQLVQEVRPTETSGDALWRFEPGDVVLQYDSAGTTRIHYTLDGEHAVPSRDDDSSGVPDYVEEVASVYDEVLAFYAAQGFLPPVSDGTAGGDDRFDVYLLDFAHASDGAFVRDPCSASSCAGFVVQENDFAGYGYPSTRVATRILGSHEVFHAVQAAYDGGQDVVFTEGSAVWASEAFDPSLRDLEAFAAHYLADPGRSLDVPPPGPVPPFAYGAGIFFRFLEERYDASLIHSLLERCVDGNGLPEADDDAGDPTWLPQLDALLAVEHESSFTEAFTTFATWNLFTGAAADPLQSYAEGEAYPDLKMEPLAAPVALERSRFFHASARTFAIDPAGRERVVVRLATDDPAQLAGLHLLVATKRDRKIVGEPVLVLESDEAVEVDAGDLVVVAVINGNWSGESLRPSLCVGSQAEVDDCYATLGPPPVEPPPEPDPEDPPPAGDELPDDGGCSSAGGGASLLALAVVSSALRRKRG